jgi:hypothetical protein
VFVQNCSQVRLLQSRTFSDRRGRFTSSILPKWALRKHLNATGSGEQLPDNDLELLERSLH